MSPPLPPPPPLSAPSDAFCESQTKDTDDFLWRGEEGGAGLSFLMNELRFFFIPLRTHLAELPPPV